MLARDGRSGQVGIYGLQPARRLLASGARLDQPRCPTRARTCPRPTRKTQPNAQLGADYQPLAGRFPRPAETNIQAPAKHQTAARVCKRQVLASGLWRAAALEPLWIADLGYLVRQSAVSRRRLWWTAFRLRSSVFSPLNPTPHAPNSMPHAPSGMPSGVGLVGHNLRANLSGARSNERGLGGPA
jgi:hypothetical protein